MKLHFILVFFIISGCSMIEKYLNMDAVTITGTIPSRSRIRADEISEVVIDFSAVMEKSKTEDAFSLSKNGKNISGVFSWKKKSLIFTPHTPFSPDNCYEISVSPEAEDKFGNSLSNKFFFEFTTSPETKNLDILSTTPGDNGSTGINCPVIAIVFSGTIDRESFYSSFSITPQVKGSISFNDTCDEAYFTPVENLQPGRDYRVDISESLIDIFGNCLGESFTFSFQAEDDRSFSVKWVGDSGGTEYFDFTETLVNYGVSSKVSLLVLFEGSVPDSIKINPITVTPYLPFSFRWENNFSMCIITFSSNLVFDNIYEINIDKNIYRLMIDDPASRPPELSRVTYCGSSANPVFEELTLDSSVNFLSSDNAFFDFYFHLAEGSFLGDYAIFSSVEFLTLNGDLAVEQRRIINPAGNALPPPSSSLESPPLGVSEYIVRIECVITAGVNPSIFRITVDSELEDSEGNTLGEDAVVQVNSL